MFEALLLAAAQATTPASAPAATPVRASPPAAAKAPPPSAELLEFLADWSEEEGGLIDEVAGPAGTPPAAARTPAAKP